MPKYFDFEVALLEVERRIWRRFLLATTGTFEHLHLAIQDACGWENYHLYVFRTETGYDRECEMAGSPGEEFMERAVPDGTRVRLSGYFGEGKIPRCYYIYDFGDTWWHEVIFRGM